MNTLRPNVMVGGGWQHDSGASQRSIWANQQRRAHYERIYAQTLPTPGIYPTTPFVILPSGHVRFMRRTA